MTSIDRLGYDEVENRGETASVGLSAELRLLNRRGLLTQNIAKGR